MKITLFFVTAAFLVFGGLALMYAIDGEQDSMWACIAADIISALLIFGIYGVCRAVRLLFAYVFPARNRPKQSSFIKSPSQLVIEAHKDLSRTHTGYYPAAEAGDFEKVKKRPSNGNQFNSEIDNFETPNEVKGFVSQTAAVSASTHLRKPKLKLTRLWQKLTRIILVKTHRFIRDTKPMRQELTIKSGVMAKSLAGHAEALGSEAKKVYLQKQQEAKIRQEKEELELQRQKELFRLQREELESMRLEQAKLSAENPSMANIVACRFCGEAILVTALKCKHCQSNLTEQPVQRSEAGCGNTLSLTAGVIIIAISGVAVLFFLTMRTTAPGSNINNIGLLNDRSVGIMMSIGGLLFGGVLLAVGLLGGRR